MNELPPELINVIKSYVDLTTINPSFIIRCERIKKILNKKGIKHHLFDLISNDIYFNNYTYKTKLSWLLNTKARKRLYKKNYKLYKFIVYIMFIRMNNIRNKYFENEIRIKGIDTPLILFDSEYTVDKYKLDMYNNHIFYKVKK